MKSMTEVLYFTCENVRQFDILNVSLAWGRKSRRQ